jgi:hypothetical protein
VTQISLNLEYPPPLTLNSECETQNRQAPAAAQGNTHLPRGSVPGGARGGGGAESSGNKQGKGQKGGGAESLGDEQGQGNTHLPRGSVPAGARGGGGAQGGSAPPPSGQGSTRCTPQTLNSKTLHPAPCILNLEP